MEAQAMCAAHFPLGQGWNSNLKFFVLRSFACYVGKKVLYCPASLA